MRTYQIIIGHHPMARKSDTRHSGLSGAKAREELRKYRTPVDNGVISSLTLYREDEETLVKLMVADYEANGLIVHYKSLWG